MSLDIITPTISKLIWLLFISLIRKKINSSNKHQIEQNTSKRKYFFLPGHLYLHIPIANMSKIFINVIIKLIFPLLY